VCTFDPISFDSNCVCAAAALFAAGFATTSVCDPYVVTSAATLCTTRNRQFSLHLLMIRECWCVHLFHTGRRPDKWSRQQFRTHLMSYVLINAITGKLIQDFASVAASVTVSYTVRAQQI
jgi:hypothetical protein